MTDAVAVAYALFGAVDADAKHKTPADVQVWLKAAEPIAIACTALNGICTAIGIALGKWVDDQTADDGENNIGATKFVIKDGRFELATDTSNGEPSPMGCAKLTLDRKDGITVKTGPAGGGASITLDGDSIRIDATTITIYGDVKFLKAPPPTTQPPELPPGFGGLDLSGTGEGGGGSGQGVPAGWP